MSKRHFPSMGHQRQQRVHGAVERKKQMQAKTNTTKPIRPQQKLVAAGQASNQVGPKQVKEESREGNAGCMRCIQPKCRNLAVHSLHRIALFWCLVCEPGANSDVIVVLIALYRGVRPLEQLLLGSSVHSDRVGCSEAGAS